ncbi:antibiotic biosynthesis monooxygenase [Streptomyces sp. CA-294286]|uniref:antibiotic biosynthesis monooxygenase n=1 Tax=Streptomyces sp. CA-294286 TaxID=3240070 RepID=UPI003D8BD0D3
MTATVTRDRPDLTRPGVGVVKVSTWDVGSSRAQRAAVAAIERAWLSRDWPDTGLLSYSVYVGEDGRTLMHYSQWRNEEAYGAFVTEERDGRNAEIDAAVPGVQRLRLDSYDLYRSSLTEGDDRLPGSVALVEVDFEGPDRTRAREWVDAVFAVLEGPSTEADAPRTVADGSLAAHFHVSRDGARALNLAEWVDAASHEAMMNAPKGPAGEVPAEWRRVHEFPGLAASRVRRYTPALTLGAGV